MSSVLDFVRRVVRCRPGWQRAMVPSHRAMLTRVCGGLGCALIFAALIGPFPGVRMPAVASDGTVTVFLRVEAPVDRDTFSQTGDYVCVWAGEVTVPREVTITAQSGRQYRLFVEDGRYKSTRLDTLEVADLVPTDDALGATSVLAALDAASDLGGFSYQVTDMYYPGQGFFVTSIDGVAATGAVGWSYRVWNEELAASPQVSVERFLLGYDSGGVALPHTQVLFYWGYSSRCLPLRVTPRQISVQCGLPAVLAVEAFVDAPGGGEWRPVQGASVCVGNECRISDSAGMVELVFAATGTFRIDARSDFDGDNYYVPADGLSAVTVDAPCVVVSFTVQDLGTSGIDFGSVIPGAAGVPERGQTSEYGAVRLVVGEETTVDCVLELKAWGPLAGDGAEMPLSGITWGLYADGTGAAPMTTTYADVGSSEAGVEASYDVWLWLSVPDGQRLGVYDGAFRYHVRVEGT